MSAEQIQLLVLITGISLGFYVQMIAGFGSALVALPILLTGMDIQEATAVLSMYFFAFSVIQIYKNYKLADRRTTVTMLIGTVFGIAVGIVLLKLGKPLILKKFLGIFILLYVASRLFKPRQIKWVDKAGLLFGFGSGIFSGLFSTGGPLCVVYVYNKMFKPDIFRATVIVILGLMDIIKLPVLIATNILNTEVAFKAIYAVPFFFLAMLLGKITYPKINEVFFRKMLLGLLFVSALFLIIR